MSVGKKSIYDKLDYLLLIVLYVNIFVRFFRRVRTGFKKYLIQLKLLFLSFFPPRKKREGGE